MARRSQKRVLLLLLLPVVILITFILHKYSESLTDEYQHVLSNSLDKSSDSSANLCPMPITCPEKHFSFFIQSGAASAVAPRICFQAQMVLGTAMKNAGFGINIVIINGKTGEVVKTGNFDMYGGDVEELIKFLNSIETGTIVLMATFDESASKLNDEGRKLITELGSSMIQSLGFRDNWVFVGGKGADVTSHLEKFRKSDSAVNLYEGWPELIVLEGCVPRFPE